MSLASALANIRRCDLLKRCRKICSPVGRCFPFLHISTKGLKKKSNRLRDHPTSASSAMLEQKPRILTKIDSSITKLEFVRDLQHTTETLYADTLRLTKEDVHEINEHYLENLTEDVYSLFMSIGASILERDLMVELYKFNEYLSRLLRKRQEEHSSAETGFAETRTIDSMAETLHTSQTARSVYGQVSYDASLVLETLFSVVILKLTRIMDLIKRSKSDISSLEVKLIEDILSKNISNRMLKPYHSIIYSKAEFQIANALNA